MPRGLHVVDRLAGHVPGIARVVFLGERILDVADHRQGLVFAKRIEKGRFGYGHDEHVRLIDGLPAADAGPIEAEAFIENAFIECISRDGKMLPQAGEIHETEVNTLDFFFTNQRQYFFWSHVGHPPLVSCPCPVTLPDLGATENTIEQTM